MSDVGKYAPPNVRDKLFGSANDNFAQPKEISEDEWLNPLRSDLRRMPLHTALAFATAIIMHLQDAKIESIDLALAMNKWARNAQGEHDDGRNT